MSRLELRGADAFMTEQSDEAGKRFRELIGIPESTFKKAELLPGRADRFGDKLQADDRLFRGEIFEMGVHHPEEHFRVMRRGGDFEEAFVFKPRAKAEPQSELGSDAINSFQPENDLIEQPAEDEKERLEALDLVLELDALLEARGRLHTAQRPH